MTTSIAEHNIKTNKIVYLLWILCVWWIEGLDLILFRPIPHENECVGVSRIV